MGQARVQTAFGQERNITTQNVPITPTIDSAGGVVHFEVPFIVFPGERRLVIRRQKALREQLSVGVMDDVR